MIDILKFKVDFWLFAVIIKGYKVSKNIILTKNPIASVHFYLPTLKSACKEKILELEDSNLKYKTGW